MPWLSELPKRLTRLSWFTWLVFLGVGFAMMLIAVPGDQVSNSIEWDGTPKVEWSKPLHERVEAGYTHDGIADRERVRVDQYRHGWPLPCLTRGVGRVVLMTRRPGPNKFNGWKENFVRGHERAQPVLKVSLPSDGDAYTFVPIPGRSAYRTVSQDWEEVAISWSDYNRWPIATDAAEWRLGSLLLDLLILALVPLLAAIASEWWVRRRGGAMRFRMTDLLVSVLVLSASLGWYRSHASLVELEQRLDGFGLMAVWPISMSEVWIELQQGPPRNDYVRSYKGPDWARRLLGSEEFLRFTKHAVAVQLVPNESWSESIDILPRLCHIEMVSLPCGVTREALDRIATLPNLRRVYVGFDEQSKPAGVSVDSEGYKRFLDKRLSCEETAALRSLPVPELGLMGENLIYEDIDEIASMPTLRRLELVQATISQEQVDRLRQDYPHLQIECSWGYEYWATYTPRLQHGFESKAPGKVDRRIERIKEKRAAIRVREE